ncbi:hypothetical protein D3C76_1643380 [compost metagenome]
MQHPVGATDIEFLGFRGEVGLYIAAWIGCIQIGLDGLLEIGFAGLFWVSAPSTDKQRNHRELFKLHGGFPFRLSGTP